jgi:hypothetical protein
MTPQQAARLLRSVGDQTISNRVRDGVIDGHDRGEGKRPRWLVARAAVQELLTDRSPDEGQIRRRIDELEEENSRLRAEVAKLGAMAEQLGIALQAATAAAQQALLPTFPPTMH